MSNQLLPYMDRIPKIELLQPQRDAVTMSKALELFLEQESSWGREEAAPDAFLFMTFRDVIHTSSARKYDFSRSTRLRRENAGNPDL